MARREASAGAGVLGRGAQDLVDRAPVRPRLDRVRLEPREVEQLLDQPRQPLGLLRDAGGELAPVVVVDVLAGERLGGGDDPGQRRAQVVADGAQQRRS